MADDPLVTLDTLAPQAAADAGPLLAAAALSWMETPSAAAFSHASALRWASDTLAAAARDEAAAEARASFTEADFRSAHETLVRAAKQATARFAAAPDDPHRAAAVAALRKGLTAWLDPYAEEAAGSAELAAWAHTLDRLPPALAPTLEPVRHAMRTAREHGATWDTALAARARAIAHRVDAQRTWAHAVVALANAVGRGPWMDLLTQAAQATPALDTWFDEGDTDL